MARLNLAFNDALKDAGVVGRLEKLGLEVVGGPPEALAEAQRTDAQRWSQVVKAAGLHVSE